MRSLALVWFLLGSFAAPVLAAGGLVSVGWLTTTRQWTRRPDARSATLLVLLLAATLALGVPIWDSRYAQ